ncbi:MAG: glycosyltransferase family 4 protein [Planctomycetota bacterium]
MAKVLHLYNVFGAATERTMLEVPLALAERGHDLTFAAETIAVETPAVSQRVVAVPRIEVQPAADIDTQMQAIAEAAPAINDSFDLVHGHFGPRGLHAARYLHRGVPVILTTYGYDVSRLLRDPCWGERYRWLGEHGATFVALSEAMAATLLGVGVPRDKVEVIPLGIDLSRWPYTPRPVGSARFLFVGRLVPKKGLGRLIEAVAICSRWGMKLSLNVVGGGEPAVEAAYIDQARQLGASALIDFVGRVPYEELGEAMRSATALVAPSETAPDGDAEGCPMVLMQAQAVGTPVITTRHAGNAEALPSAAQRFVVDEGDAEGLAAAMRDLIRLEPETRAQLQAAGRSWIETRFDLQRTVEQYDTLYRRLALSGA